MAEENAAQPGHETRDINARGVALFAAGLLVAVAVIYLAVIGVYKFFAHEIPSPDRPSRIAFDVKNVAPQPQLQIDPAVDLEKMRAADEAKLNSYGWVDKDAGIVRISIARAMDLIAQRGLPTRGPSTQNASGLTAVDMQKRKAEATKP
ncbi:MAG: hypothetical protein M3119_06315 [Verrucomicrobiota bacterium]|nr:hypothetical protein [Verrucomicrobiota bacterium]MDQ6939756.1 hypothetical protein [Verrucomicrobiota bacterium]